MNYDNSNGGAEPNSFRIHLQTILNDLKAAAAGVQVIFGEKLGLYKVLAATDGLTSDELAARSGTSRHFALKWLESQVKVGYVDYDRDLQLYKISLENAALLTNEDSPAHGAIGSWELDAIYDCDPSFSEVLQSLIYIHRDLSNGESHRRIREGNKKLVAILEATAG